FVASLEDGRAFDASAGADRQGFDSVLGVEPERDDAAGRSGGAQLHAEQLEEYEALSFWDQMGAVQQRIPEPGEQLDQGSAWIADAWVGPLRSVSRYTRDQLRDEVVEAAVI